MTNGLLAAVYSTGMLNIWSIVSGRCIVSLDLFDGMENGESSRRVIQAKI